MGSDMTYKRGMAVKIRFDIRCIRLPLKLITVQLGGVKN